MWIKLISQMFMVSRDVNKVDQCQMFMVSCDVNKVNQSQKFMVSCDVNIINIRKKNFHPHAMQTHYLIRYIKFSN